MKRCAPKPSRAATSAPQGSPDPLMPADDDTLQAALRLARAQNAYLHRELATALKQAPLAPRNVDGGTDALAAENASLRERLALLTLHHKDLQNRYETLQQSSRQQERDFDALLRSMYGGTQEALQSSFVAAPVDLAQTLVALLTLAHPDKWSQGQPATELAHEITIALNALRQQGERL
jgi:hypothetical protein